MIKKSKRMKMTMISLKLTFLLPWKHSSLQNRSLSVRLQWNDECRQEGREEGHWQGWEGNEGEMIGRPASGQKKHTVDWFFDTTMWFFALVDFSAVGGFTIWKEVDHFQKDILTFFFLDNFLDWPTWHWGFSSISLRLDIVQILLAGNLKRLLNLALIRQVFSLKSHSKN